MSGLYVGVITGTSVDGLDLALLEIDSAIRFVASDTVALPDDLRDELLSLSQPGPNEIDRLGAADARLGCAIGEAVNGFLATAGVDRKAVSAIGSHGQTVRHRPDTDTPFTLQIGDPNRVVEATGITCVADFRRRDMAAGGQGAPLVPPFHAALFGDSGERRIILNIGGISNVTVLPADPSEDITGFDTGPGNCLMDGWISRCRSMPYDRDGAWARQGSVSPALLAAMLADPYASRPPPKSTGREYYNLDWLNGHPEIGPLNETDVQATLAEFTARSIADAVGRWGGAVERLLVCGGGRHNRLLIERLAQLAPCAVETTDAHGVDGDALEAGAFAWLAHQTLADLPGSAPGVTGASGGRILGGIYRE
ncbi:MAG: anhydro-N-acetylmuramic acid kinase [Pseudomonadales bacterium]|nr:anhydro-N-acetylmuramic acid kinase [Pseudomonadales bacterium]NIX09348.1 anhydro-N-acetylmuramic acid kinase [Pseudomonadales bacterium]